jgi:hypothetical protein
LTENPLSDEDHDVALSTPNEQFLARPEGRNMETYLPHIETQMQRFYRSLSEKDQRRYAALEALKLGHGGRGYMKSLLGCDYKTLQRGERDLADDDALASSRIRLPGGGRKKNSISARQPMRCSLR